MRTSWATCWPSLVRSSYFLDESALDVFLGLVSSSLRTGNPLPQVTPCPLLYRFMERQQGLNIVHEESEEDFGLPKVLTEETLESLQYLYVTPPPLFHYEFFIITHTIAGFSVSACRPRLVS